MSTAGPSVLDRRSPLPLWAQLDADLRRRLDNGEFAGAFPAEHALVSQYAVSRQTVREALRRLRAEGLVTAERGRAPHAQEVMAQARASLSIRFSRSLPLQKAFARDQHSPRRSANRIQAKKNLIRQTSKGKNHLRETPAGRLHTDPNMRFRQNLGGFLKNLQD